MSYLVWLAKGTACELCSVAKEQDWMYSFLVLLAKGTGCTAIYCV